LADIITDTTLVTVDATNSVHYAAGIAIADGRIAAIGPSREILDRFPHASRVHGRGKVVMPGLANTHAHLYLTIARGLFEDYPTYAHPPYDEVNRPPIPRLSREERSIMAQLGALEGLRSGTTFVLDDTLRADDYAADLVPSGLRIMFAERTWDRARATVSQQGSFDQDPALGAATLERGESLYRQWHGAAGGRISVAVSAWSPDTCSPEHLKKLRALQERLDVPATIHLNQAWGEVAAVKRHRNLLPSEYLHSVGFLSDRLIAAHCRCMTAAEEKILGHAGVVVAFNSCMAARRGLSPNIAALEQHGCRITIGTDNMAYDMVEAMRTGMFMERVRRHAGGDRPTADEALTWATANGYRAMGVPDGGALIVGNRADLIMIDTVKAHLVPTTRFVSAFVHQGQASDVVGVMVDGQWLVRDGRVLTLDEPLIVREAERIGHTRWAERFAELDGAGFLPGFAPRPPSA
jgi:5-methylthioadenosine/S-adenosylhomocysteine deaminase